MRQTTFKGQTPFPRRQIDVAEKSTRYVGLYYWTSWSRQWDHVLDVGADGWLMQAVDVLGTPRAMPRRHNSTLWACGFAD